MTNNSIMKDDEEWISDATAIARWAQRAFKAETESDRLRTEVERLQRRVAELEGDISGQFNDEAELYEDQLAKLRGCVPANMKNEAIRWALEELDRLRAELAQLRARVTELETAQLAKPISLPSHPSAAAPER